MKRLLVLLLSLMLVTSMLVWAEELSASPKLENPTENPTSNIPTNNQIINVNNSNIPNNKQIINVDNSLTNNKTINVDNKTINVDNKTINIYLEPIIYPFTKENIDCI